MYGDKTSSRTGVKKFKMARTTAGNRTGKSNGRSRNAEGKKMRNSSKKRSGKKLATI